MISLLQRFIKDLRGVAAVEFALIAPVMLVMLIGTIELSNYMMAARRADAAAYTAADLISQETDITTSDLDEIFQASRLIMSPFNDTDLALGAASVRYDNSTGNPTEDWSGSYNGGSVNNAATLATGMGSAGESVIIVTATYAYTPILGIILSGTYTLSETIITRPRYINYVGFY